MKVLVLGWELPPYNAGGMGVECVRYCKALAREGVDIEFIIPYTITDHQFDYMTVRSAYPQNVVEVLKAGTTYDSIKYTHITSTGEQQTVDLYEQVMRYESGICAMVPELEFDIIHANDWLTCRAAIRAKMISGRPLVIHVHSLESDRAGQAHGGNPIVREIEALSLMMADRIIAVSDVTKRNMIREYGILADKIEVVHNNLDMKGLALCSGDNEYYYLNQMKKQGYRIVVNIGRLTIQKGLSHLLKAFSLVVKRRPKSLLLIVGSGEQYQELIALSAVLGIADKVIFTDFQRGKRWRDAFSIADLYVLSSPTEPFGIAALEAINYKTPILISKDTGVSEVIHNALRVDYWDYNEMANKIMSVLNNDTLRDTLSHNAFCELESLVKTDKTADKLITIYKKHVSGERLYE